MMFSDLPSLYIANNKIDLGLKRVKFALNKLGNPHKKIKSKIVHIAGTNGKGSTLAFIKSILEEHGITVNRYTSPHLLNITERIEVFGKPIDYDLFDKSVKSVLKVDRSLTSFEAMTVAAFDIFSRNQSDVILLETGLGGRLDATNVITPTVSLISKIGLDHEKFLGNTLDSIAFEKSGIIKKNIPIVTVIQEKKALDVICNEARKKKSELEIANAQNILSNINLSLNGKHQIENASLAYCALKYLNLDDLGFCLNNDLIVEGFKKTSWPGRLMWQNIRGIINRNTQEIAQKITQGNSRETTRETTRGIIQGDTIGETNNMLLDCAHNTLGAKVLREYILGLNKSFFALIAMKADKNAESFLSIMKDTLYGVAFLKINDDLFHSSKYLSTLANNIGYNNVYEIDDVIHVLGVKNLLVTGSFEILKRVLNIT